MATFNIVVAIVCLVAFFVHARDRAWGWALFFLVLAVINGAGAYYRILAQ